MGEINWLKVEQIQRKSYYGQTPSSEELELCRQAMEADPERYANYGKDLRQEYRDSLKFK